jgi:hypothetical protein
MTLSRTLRRWAFALTATLGTMTTASAADETPAPVPVPAAPAVAGCPTCTGEAPAAGCSTCGKGHLGLLGKKKAPYVPYLCPGACFGYFQTRWNKWDDVCPLPYQGAGATDAPPPAPGYVPPVPPPPGQAQPMPLPMPKGGETKKPEAAPEVKKSEGGAVENPRPMQPMSTPPAPIPAVPPPGKTSGSSITPGLPTIPVVVPVQTNTRFAR